jgi:hypothetical protein
VTVPLCGEFVLARASINCGASSAGRGACALVFMRTFNLARGVKCVVTQLPARLAFAPEALKQALAAACALAGHAADGTLSVAAVAVVAAHALASLTLVMLLVTLHADPTFSDRYVPPGLDACPAALRPAREALLSRCTALARRVHAPPLDYRALSGLALCANMLAGRMFVDGVVSFALVGRVTGVIYGLLSLGSLSATALAGGGTATLGAMAQRLGVDADRARIDALNAALAAADDSSSGSGGGGGARASERDVLRAALRQLRTLFPGATAMALGAFAAAEGDEGDMDELCSFGLCSEAVATLYAASTSVECVASQARTLIADSRDFPAGMKTFADWAVACADGSGGGSGGCGGGGGNGNSSGSDASSAGAGCAVTAPLPAGPAKVGFVTLRFPTDGRRGGGGPGEGYEALLLAACHVIGEHLWARRERAALASSRALASDIFPEHVLRVLERRTRRMSSTGIVGGGGIGGGGGSSGALSALATGVAPMRSSSLPTLPPSAMAAAAAAAAARRSSPRGSPRRSSPQRGSPRGTSSARHSVHFAPELLLPPPAASGPRSPLVLPPGASLQDGEHAPGPSLVMRAFLRARASAAGAAASGRLSPRSSAPQNASFGDDDTGGPDQEAARRASLSSETSALRTGGAPFAAGSGGGTARASLSSLARSGYSGGGGRVSMSSVATTLDSSWPEEDETDAPEDDDLFAEAHACISVIFIDIVGFTTMAESQSAAATMRTLHALFSRFDTLCGRHGLYKVETIGDCCAYTRACMRALFMR